MRKYIFSDEICDAKWTEEKPKDCLKCCKGTLVFTGNNVQDFALYRQWCSECTKIVIINKKEYIKNFKTFIKYVERETDGL